MKKRTTTEAAESLLYEGGEFSPSQERIQLTRWLMDTCEENCWEVSAWNEPLYPALDSFGDVEVLLAVEETFGISIDDAEIRAAPLETFGDLVRYLEPRVAPAMTYATNERLKMARASCATQTAFYAVRRRLCEAGANYHCVHALRPSSRLDRIPAAQATPFAEGLGTDYGLIIAPYWNPADAKTMQHILLILSAIFCFWAVPALPGSIPLNLLLCVVFNLMFALLKRWYTRPEWPRDVQTLGDVARKIAEVAAPPPAAQPAHS